MLGAVRSALLEFWRTGAAPGQPLGGQTAGAREQAPAGLAPVALPFDTRGDSPAKVDAKTAAFIGTLSPSTSPIPDAEPLMETDEISGAVGRCLEVVGRDLGSCPVQLFDVANREKPKELFEHEALTLLRHINPTWYPQLFWEHMAADILGNGNSFTWLDLRGAPSGRPGLRRPVNMLRYRPQRMHIVPDERKMVGGYVYLDDQNEEHPLTAAEVMHIRTRNNSSSPYRGIGALERLRHTILINREMENFQYWRFKKGLPIGLLLKTDAVMPEEEALAFVENLYRNYAGSKNAGKPMLLQKGSMEVEQIQRPTEEEIAFIASMKFTRSEIAMVFGVPPVKLGDYSDAFRANADQQERSYWEDTIRGLQLLVLGYMNSVFLPLFWPQEKLELRFDISQVRALQQSANEIADVNEKGVRSAWMTPNEARKRAGMEPYDDEAADKLYWNGRPLGEDPFASLLNPGIGKPEEDAGEGQPPEPVGEQAQRRLIIVRTLPGNLLDPEEEARKLREKVRAILAEMYRIAGEEILEISNAPAGFGFNVKDPNVFLLMDQQAIKVSLAVVATTVEAVRLAIATGIEQGLAVVEMRDLIQEAFVERRADWQLDRIGRTESHQAHQAGGHSALVQNRIENRRWLSSRDNLVRGTDPGDAADHVALNDTILPVGVPFVDPRNGDHLRYPGDPSASAGSVINCRCNEVADFSHLKSWRVPDFDGVWTRQVGTQDTFRRAFVILFRREIEGMERRALKEFDAQTQAAA